MYISARRLLHPITLVGFTALSVDTITNRSALYFTAMSATLRVPRTFTHPDSFARIGFHQWYVLVGRGVEYHLGSKAAKDGFYPILAPYVADNRSKGECGEFFFQFEPQVMHGGFATVEKNQLLDVEFGKLAADFTTDRACRSCNQYCFSRQTGGYFAHVDVDFLPSQ